MLLKDEWSLFLVTEHLKLLLKWRYSGVFYKMDTLLPSMSIFERFNRISLCNLITALYFFRGDYIFSVNWSGFKVTKETIEDKPAQHLFRWWLGNKTITDAE